MPDLSHYSDREQGYVKHAIIEKYLERFAIKVSSRWRCIIYLDAFAGPWGSVAEDLSDTSFCIALKQLKLGTKVAEERFSRSIHVDAYLIEQNNEAFQKLKEFGEKQEGDNFNLVCLNGAFEEKLHIVKEKVLSAECRDSFLFALIDPKGWSGLSMELIAPILRRRSSEVLVNVMTSFIQRFVDVEQCKDSYKKFFGRPEVRDIISATPHADRADVVVREYCRSLRDKCNFKYLSSAVVLDPNKDSIKYFMVFGTNDPMGIKVFKEAEAHAASLQDQVKNEIKMNGQGSLFPEFDAALVSQPLRSKYKRIAFDRILELFDEKEHRIEYEEVFCKGMAMPLVTETDLVNFIYSRPELKFQLNGKKRRVPGIGKKDFVVKLSD